MTKYAYFNSALAGPSPVMGWYDSEDFNAAALAALPEKDLLAVTDGQWTGRMTGQWTVSGGALTVCAPSIAAPPLAQQAQAALAAARAYVQNTYLILNETTPDAWVTYIKALMAIAGGTDTVSTALPAKPAP